MNRLAFLLLAAVLALPACGPASKGGGKAVIETPKLPPVKPEALREFDAALRALRRDRRARAIDRLRAAVAIDPSLWEAWHDLGVLLFRAGDDRGATDAFGRALKVNRAHTPSLLARAEARRRAGDAAAARRDYEAVLEREPESLSTYARLASLLREEGEHEDGLEVLREALRVAGADSSIYVELGLIYLAQGRDELAELVLTKAAALDAESPAIHNALALVALEAGDDQLAFNRFDKATALDPRFVDARYNTAAVLIDAGDYARAAAELEAVTKQSPDDFAAQVALGVCARGLGELPRARRIWSKVVERAPSGSRARDDALYNLAVLEMDFEMNDAKARAALDRFLQEASSDHPKRSRAEERRKELGQ